MVLPVLAAFASLEKCGLLLLQVLLEETLPFPQKLLASSIACVYWLSLAEDFALSTSPASSVRSEPFLSTLPARKARKVFS